MEDPRPDDGQPKDRASRPGEPTWELARLYPNQGEWTEEVYLALGSKRLIEYSDGCLEFPPIPTLFHQRIVLFLFRLLDELVRRQEPGEVQVAPLPVRLWPGKYREPDLVFLANERLRGDPEYPEGADLVMEVVSGGPEDRKRDLVIKRQEYARAGIPEYWIVDPEEEKIEVLVLENRSYRISGTYGPGDQAASRLLHAFRIDVSDLLAAGRRTTDENP